MKHTDRNSEPAALIAANDNAGQEVARMVLLGLVELLAKVHAQRAANVDARPSCNQKEA